MNHELAFHHLLHDLANRVSGIGPVLADVATMETLDPGDREALAAAADAADTLTDLVTDVRALTVCLEHADHEPCRVAVTRLLEEVQVASSGADLTVCIAPAAQSAQITVRAAMFVATLAVLVRAVGRPDRPVTIEADADGRVVAVAIRAAGRIAAPGHAVDYLADCVAALHGTAFTRVSAAGGHSVTVTLPCLDGATATRACAS